MTDVAIDEVLARLVAQFASPYDFLRELVQNAMDAGSDRVEVFLHTHEVGGEQVVYELEVADAGSGMDEAILDGELTKLFASGKTGDRTMAGGFGIGFVSVFAWEPEMALLHTGRSGETWELVFHADRRFEKHRVDVPFEGTTVRLFRRGAPDEREGIADAVRQSLWRWCRFVPLEVVFEDVASGTGPETIHDEPPPDEEALVEVHEQAETRVRVAFAVPPHAVLLRHGLVLAEGMPAETLPHVAGALGGALDHLRVWADSPLLRTDLARDHVIDDDGRRSIERIVLALVGRLQDELLTRLEALAATAGPWTAELHAQYAWLHAHLSCELATIGRRVRERPLVRLASGGASSIATLVRRARSGLVIACDPSAHDGETIAAQAVAEQAAMPTIVATAMDRAWLAPLVPEVELRPLARALARVEPAGVSDGLAALVQQVLAKARLPVAAVRLGRFGDVAAIDAWGLEVHAAPAFVGLALPKLPRRDAQTVWLDERHVLVAGAVRHATIDPLTAAAALALLVARGWPEPLDLDDFVDAVDAVRAA